MFEIAFYILVSIVLLAVIGMIIYHQVKVIHTGKTLDQQETTIDNVKKEMDVVNDSLTSKMDNIEGNYATNESLSIESKRRMDELSKLQYEMNNRVSNEVTGVRNNMTDQIGSVNVRVNALSNQDLNIYNRIDNLNRAQQVISDEAVGFRNELSGQRTHMQSMWLNMSSNITANSNVLSNRINIVQEEAMLSARNIRNMGSNVNTQRVNVAVAPNNNAHGIVLTTDALNVGFASVNFNGATSNGVNTRFAPNKSRWRIYADQRGASDTLGVDQLNPNNTIQNYVMMKGGTIDVAAKAQMQSGVMFGASSSKPYSLDRVQSVTNTSFLRLGLSDDTNKSFQIWSRDCPNGVCAGQPTVRHTFDSAGNTVHAGESSFASAALRNKGCIELGKGIAGKEANAGKLCYNRFSTNAVDIVGAGAPGTKRRVKIWDRAEVEAIDTRAVHVNNKWTLQGNPNNVNDDMLHIRNVGGTGLYGGLLADKLQANNTITASKGVISASVSAPANAGIMNINNLNAKNATNQGVALHNGATIMNGGGLAVGQASKKMPEGQAFISQRLGVGTVDPKASIHSTGDGLFGGNVTARAFYGDPTTSAPLVERNKGGNNKLGVANAGNKLKLYSSAVNADGDVSISMVQSDGSMRDVLTVDANNNVKIVGKFSLCDPANPSICKSMNNPDGSTSISVTQPDGTVKNILTVDTNNNVKVIGSFSVCDPANPTNCKAVTF
jgi:hypothetical protein